MARGLVRGEVRLCQFAPPDKQRPVLILTRDQAIPYLTRVTVAPVTSTIRGIPSEVLLTEDDGMKAHCVVNLHNVLTLPHTQLGRRVAKLSSAKMREVCDALHFCFGCDQD